jgi:hypothetical protein
MNLELYMDFVSSFESFLSLFWMKMENKVFSLSYKLKSNMDIYIRAGILPGKCYQ